MTSSRSWNPPARRLLLAASVAAVALGAGSAAGAGADLARLALPGGPAEVSAPSRLALVQGLWSAKVDPSLAGATGAVDVWVRLARPSLAAANGENAKTQGGLLTLSERKSYAFSLSLEQDGVAAVARALGGRELGRVSRAHNAVAVSIDAARLQDLASALGVTRVAPVLNYELALSETVPYIGAAAAQAAGFDGTGARVAVLDSGIDYTHYNLGGPGTTAAYATAVSTFPNPYFPSSKVVGGFDFVGSDWPSKPEKEDPNPIDDGAGGGHGTHVSDIIAGRSADGKHVGVAPGAKLYAVKVCSSVSTSCSGVALLKAVDFALDPDGDGTLNPVDVINLSLGSNYGQVEDDLSFALSQAVRTGVVVVAAAGNAGNRPYIVSSPSIAPAAISVAQTQVPSAISIPLVVNSPAAIANTYRNTERVDWSPVDHPVTGDVAYVGRGCPAGSISATSPDDPYLTSPSGKVALIDRGACAVSLKIDRAVQAGATAVLIGLVAPGDAISFSFGGGSHFAPTLIIIQADANRIKGQISGGATVNVTISPANAIPLVGSVVSSSARGPSISFQTIKPEIGAPGASVSAQFATGNGQTAFGGTSGATPMISGSAAILLGAKPWLRPSQVKAMLMNNAETVVYQNQALNPGKLAPISRIGAGEVRVDRALGAKAAAWVRKDKSAAISFGYHAVSHTLEVERTVRLENLSGKGRTYHVDVSFLQAAKDTGAVEVRAPHAVHVGGHEAEEFEVTAIVHPDRLPDWTLNGGSQGGNGPLLDTLEFDGHLTLTAGSEKLSLPWHILPHKAAALEARSRVRAGHTLEIENHGAADGVVEPFALTGTSAQLPASVQPGPGDNFAIIDLKAVGVRAVGASAPNDTLQIGISTFGGRATPNYPAEFDVYIDKDLDGVPDYVVYNLENGGFGVSGQNVVAVQKLKLDSKGNLVPDGSARVFYYADADLNSSNVIFTAPLAALGMTADTQFAFSVYAFDNYFTGALTDAIENMVHTPSMPRYAIADIPVIAPRAEVHALVTEASANAAASPSQTGILLQYRDSSARHESQAVLVH